MKKAFEGELNRTICDLRNIAGYIIDDLIHLIDDIDTNAAIDVAVNQFGMIQDVGKFESLVGQVHIAQKNCHFFDKR